MTWAQALGELAEAYHFQPSELGRFTLADLQFWSDRLQETKARWHATPEADSSPRRSNSR